MTDLTEIDAAELSPPAECATAEPESYETYTAADEFIGRQAHPVNWFVELVALDSFTRYAPVNRARMRQS